MQNFQRHLLLSQARHQIATGCMIRRAYVGQFTPLANEYHSQDYDWAEHAKQTTALVEAQWAAAPETVRQKAQLSSTGATLSAVAQLLHQLQMQKEQKQDGYDNSSTCVASTSQESSTPSSGVAGCTASVATMQQGQPQQTQQVGDNGHTCKKQSTLAVQAPTAEAAAKSAQPAQSDWELFYQAHPTARFFKERRYLLLEFPCLAPPSQLRHVVEIGAGCGSSLLPILRAQPEARATACDVSSTCLDQLNAAVKLLGMEPERCSTFVADGTDPALGVKLAGSDADAVLVMFTLSAVMPEGMLVMMRNAAAALKPGGLLCIRDHALYDMVQLRIPAQQCIGKHLFRRGDGTLAYFYTVEELSGLAKAAGLEVLECSYVCVINRNRKTGQELRRAFVHGLFKRPK